MTIYTAFRLMKTPDLLKYNLSSVEMVAYSGGRSDEETITFLRKLFYNADLYSCFSKFIYFLNLLFLNYLN